MKAIPDRELVICEGMIVFNGRISLGKPKGNKILQYIPSKPINNCITCYALYDSATGY